MNATVEIALAAAAMLAVYAACRRDWPTAVAAVVGVLILGIMAIVLSSEDKRPRLDC